MNLNNKKHIRLFFEIILSVVAIFGIINLFNIIEIDIVEIDIIAIIGGLFFGLIILGEIIDNVKVLLNKPIISIDGDYITIRRTFVRRKILISEISFRFFDMAFCEYLYLKHGSKKTMINCAYLSDDLEMKLRKAFVLSKYGEVAYQNIKNALDY